MKRVLRACLLTLAVLVPSLFATGAVPVPTAAPAVVQAKRAEALSNAKYWWCPSNGDYKSSWTVSSAGRTTVAYDSNGWSYAWTIDTTGNFYAYSSAVPDHVIETVTATHVQTSYKVFSNQGVGTC